VLVQAMAQIAKAYRKRCVAEHVDAAATMQLLREFEVDYAQGYYHGRPIPIEQMLAGASSLSMIQSV